MPYNIYDDSGNKIGQVTSTEEEIAGIALFIVLLPYILAIGLVIFGLVGLIEVYWPWAKTAHRLTRYENLNGVITCLAIPLTAFLISARWEKVANGEVGIVGELSRITAIVYIVIAFISMIFKAQPTFSRSEWFFIGPIAVSALSLLRFKPIQIIASILIGIPAMIILVIILILIVNAISGWLFR